MQRGRSQLRIYLGVVAVALVCSASSQPVLHPDAATSSDAPGRLIILPGIRNTRFHLVGFATRAAARLPNVDVEIRPWGVPLLGLHNLRAHERNVAAAARLAADITAWRHAHPADLLYVVGYSGGGGIAALAVAALPPDVRVDRLVLVAPAISADYDVSARLAPHVGDYIVNYASERDLQVGLGTRVFGTIDGIKSTSAGYAGFTASDARLVEWHWTEADRGLGHHGNHVSYLGRRWQQRMLLPVLDPDTSIETLQALWRAARGPASHG